MVTKVKRWRERDTRRNWRNIVKGKSRQTAISSSFIVFFLFVLVFFIFCLAKLKNQRNSQKWVIIVIEEFDFRFPYMQSAIKVIQVNDKTWTFVPIVPSIIRKLAIFIFGDETPLFQSHQFIFIEMYCYANRAPTFRNIQTFSNQKFTLFPVISNLNRYT